eukprot:jgi/Mesvir1/9554/Mv08978-RA.1
METFVAPPSGPTPMEVVKKNKEDMRKDLLLTRPLNLERFYRRVPKVDSTIKGVRDLSDMAMDTGNREGAFVRSKNKCRVWGRRLAMPLKTAKSGSDSWFEDLTLRPRAPASTPSSSSAATTKAVRTSKSLAPAHRVSKEPPPKDVRFEEEDEEDESPPDEDQEEDEFDDDPEEEDEEPEQEEEEEEEEPPLPPPKPAPAPSRAPSRKSSAALPASAAPAVEDSVKRYVRTTYRTDPSSLRSPALKDVLRNA